jgi:two-component system response regulator HydG
MGQSQTVAGSRRGDLQRFVFLSVCRLAPARGVHDDAAMSQAMNVGSDSLNTSSPSFGDRPSLSGSQAGVLVVDDDREMCELAQASLAPRGYPVVWRSSSEEALAELDSRDIAVLLADIHMDGMNGIELCRAALAKRPDLLVIMMTGFGSLEHAVSAMRAGAYDFITKPISMEAFALAVDRAMRHHAMSDELRRLRRRVDAQELPNMIGSSACMRRVADIVTQVAETDTNVLITGESGTGKELIARALHERSGRRGPFLAINCAAVPENLLESELFGYTKGAFTDARTTRTGFFVEANQGTLFLDEIAEMPLGMQSKILRALQERTVRPLGSTQEIAFDARIITATNKDLETEVAEKRFRARGHDILVLAQHFLERAAARSNKPVTRIGRLVAEQLASYDWPGNVRELENCMERSVALARFDEITTEDLPAKIREFQSTEIAAIGDDPDQLPSMDLVEERYVRRVLAAVGGNKTLAARILGFDRRTLYRKLARYN